MNLELQNYFRKVGNAQSYLIRQVKLCIREVTVTCRAS